MMVQGSGTDSQFESGARFKLITAVVQRGKADPVVQSALRAGAQGATIFFGRGEGMRERLGLLGLAIHPEKEVILIVVEAGLLDRVFGAMVRTGHIDQPGVGFAFVTAVEQAVGLLASVGQGKGAGTP